MNLLKTPIPSSPSPSFAVSETQKIRKRLSPQAYKITKALLAKNQSGLCGICQEPGIEEIDHINNDPSDWNVNNIRGVHGKCNRRRQRKAPTERGLNVSVEKEESAEIEISRDAEPRYRKWLFERTEKKEPLFVQEAVYGGAEFVGISPVTARRYLGKVTSPQGAYLVVTVKTSDRTLKQVIPR